MIVNAKIGEGTKIWHTELVNIYECVIGVHCRIGTFVEICNGVVIGNNCSIQSFSYIPPGVIIGNNVFIGPRVVFTNDKYPKVTKDWEMLETVVEDGVSIGAGVVILPGIKIEKNAIIGAGAVVTKNVLSNSTVIGNPAKVYKK